MFENSVTFQFRPGKAQEALLVLRECVGPVLIAQKCLLSLCFLPNLTDDEITVISAWSCAQQAQAVEVQAAYRREIVKLDRFLLNDSVVKKESLRPN